MNQHHDCTTSHAHGNSTQWLFDPNPADERIAFSYHGHDVTFDENRLINITEMWRAAGSPSSKQPPQWARHSAAQEFVASLAESLKMSQGELIRTVKGRHNGGTWAHPQVAREYKRYLVAGKKSKANLIYFIQCTTTKLIKIGVADNLISRLLSLRGQSPTRLTLLGVMEGGRKLESSLHERFATSRDHGEWFRPDPGLLRLIKSKSLKTDCVDQYNVILDGDSYESIGPWSRKRPLLVRTICKDECAHGNGPCCSVCRHAGMVVKQAIKAMGLSSDRTPACIEDRR